MIGQGYHEGSSKKKSDLLKKIVEERIFFDSLLVIWMKKKVSSCVFIGVIFLFGAVFSLERSVADREREERVMVV